MLMHVSPKHTDSHTHEHILTHTAIQNKKEKERKADKASYNSVMPVTQVSEELMLEIYKFEANLGARLRQSLKEKYSSE